jgi:polyisoprenoid-binding protein YceI
MKTKLFITALAAVTTMAFTGKKETEYKVDNQKSRLSWVGRKVVGEHSGSINIADGKLIAKESTIVGGSFNIDMRSISNTDIKDETYNQKLVEHLRSEDFFSSEKFPKSTFVITSVAPAGKDRINVKGNLTIKGITHELEFPATVQANGSEIKARARIIVDRTKFDIKYGSGSFFDNLGDKAISNEFEMDVELVAKK